MSETRRLRRVWNRIARMECDLGMCVHVRAGHQCWCRCRACEVAA